MLLPEVSFGGKKINNLSLNDSILTHAKNNICTDFKLPASSLWISICLSVFVHTYYDKAYSADYKFLLLFFCLLQSVNFTTIHILVKLKPNILNYYCCLPAWIPSSEADKSFALYQVM